MLVDSSSLLGMSPRCRLGRMVGVLSVVGLDLGPWMGNGTVDLGLVLSLKFKKFMFGRI